MLLSLRLSTSPSLTGSRNVNVWMTSGAAAATASVEHVFDDVGSFGAGAMAEGRACAGADAEGDSRAEAVAGAARSVPGAEGPEPLGTLELALLVARLGSMDVAVDDAERIERIGVLERVKAAASAAQARETVAFEVSQREAQRAAGVPGEHVGRGIAEQVALARRESPHAGSRLTGMASALVREMPCTLTALEAGDTSEWRATLMVRETACLSVADRAAVDAEVGPRLGELGNRAVEQQARAVAQRVDAASVVARAARAAADRRVTIRPAPDTMTYVTALLPVADGVAVYAALDAAARGVAARVDGQARGQVMADTLLERVTGRASSAGHHVEIGLVMRDTSLLAGGDQPAWVTGSGLTPQPVPAALARALVAGVPQAAVGRARPGDVLEGGAAAEGQARAEAWLRRLYTSPDGRHLVAMDSRRRLFDGQLRRMIVLRDQTCRTPYCDAPIRHADHVRPRHAAGETSLANAAGLCARCNHAKEAPDWRVRPDGADGEAHKVKITTPTGHTYISASPGLLPALDPRVGIRADRSERAPVVRRE